MVTHFMQFFGIFRAHTVVVGVPNNMVNVNLCKTGAIMQVKN